MSPSLARATSSSSLPLEDAFHRFVSVLMWLNSPGWIRARTPCAKGSSTAAVSFVPSAVTIHVGQTVEWVWRDSSVPHNVTFSGGFHSATQTSGTYFHTFETPDVFPYSSTIHFDMKGEVVVR